MTEQTVKKGRKPREAQDIEPINEAAFERDAQALIVHNQQATEALSRIGYDEPYDRERVVQETRFYLGQSAEAMLEAGRRLIVLKECEPHGVFADILENRLGIPTRTAQRMMQASAKYLMNPGLASNAPALAHLGSTKLFELMTESDEDLAELAEGGTVAGMTLDEIDRMTTRELKAALRETREELDSKDKLLDDKNKKIDKLTAQQKRIQKMPLDEAQEEMLKELTSEHNTIEGMVRGTYRWGFKTIMEHAAETGIDCRELLAGFLGQLQRAVLEIRDEFALPDHVGDGEAPWVKEAKAKGLMP